MVPPLADQPKITNCQDPNTQRGRTPTGSGRPTRGADISPNGDMWFLSLSLNDTRNLRNAVLVSKSEDGGATWTEPVTLIDDANPHVFNDKNSLTADPNDSGLVYAVWDRLVFPNERTQSDPRRWHAAAFEGPTYLSKTENGTDDDGGDWTTRKILDLGRNDQTIANQIAVLPRTPGRTESTLINVFDWIHNDNKQGRKGQKISAMWSTDSGDTWSDPVVIDSLAGAARLTPTPTVRPAPSSSATRTLRTSARCARPKGYRTSGHMADGTAYVAWQNGGPNGKVQIRLAKSSDHGQTWTQLGVVNGVPGTDAHTSGRSTRRAPWRSATTTTASTTSTPTTGSRLRTGIRRSSTGGASFGQDEILGTSFDTRKAPYARLLPRRLRRPGLDRSVVRALLDLDPGLHRRQAGLERRSRLRRPNQRVFRLRSVGQGSGAGRCARHASYLRPCEQTLTRLRSGSSAVDRRRWRLRPRLRFRVKAAPTHDTALDEKQQSGLLPQPRGFEGCGAVADMSEACLTPYWARCPRPPSFRTIREFNQ